MSDKTAAEELARWLANGETTIDSSSTAVKPGPYLTAKTVEEFEAEHAEKTPARKEWEKEQKAAQVRALDRTATQSMEVFCTKFDLRYTTELKFHPDRKWLFDFAVPKKHLAIEIEGGQWINGRHQRGQGFQNDCEKYNAAAILGWHVLRFTTDMVNSGTMLDTLREWGEANK
jgi:very-short-patch-repair endonuclease